MRRILLVLSIAALMAAMVVASAMPAFAQGKGPSACKEAKPGQFISFVAQEFGHSGTGNPGNAQNPFPPFVPFDVGCNPTSTPAEQVPPAGP